MTDRTTLRARRRFQIGCVVFGLAGLVNAISDERGWLTGLWSLVICFSTFWAGVYSARLWTRDR